MKRIFIAIPIAKQLQQEISLWVQNFQSSPKSKIPNDKIRWVETKNLHVTLVPPWYLPASKVEATLEQQPESLPDIIAQLQTVTGKVEPFDIQFNLVSFGPNPTEPRLIWAEGNGSEKAIELKDKIYEALRQNPDNRPFKLHLTLARFRPGDFRKFAVKTLDEKVEWKEQVKSFVIMESHLSSRGADYEILEKFKLTDADGPPAGGTDK